MWMDRLTKKQVAEVGEALNDVANANGGAHGLKDSHIAASLQISQAHLSKYRHNGVVTPTLWKALEKTGWVTPLKKRVRLSADCTTVEQREACHRAAASRGLTWSQFVQYYATGGPLELHVLKTVMELATAEGQNQQHIAAQLKALGAMLRETTLNQQVKHHDDVR